MKFGKLKKVSKATEGKKIKMYPDGSGGIKDDPKRAAARKKAMEQSSEENKQVSKPEEDFTGSGMTRTKTPKKTEYIGEKVTGYETSDVNSGDRSYGKDNPTGRRYKATDEELDKDISKGDKYSMLHKNIRTGRDRGMKIVKDSEGKIVSKKELEGLKKDVEEGSYQNPSKQNKENKSYALGKVKHESVTKTTPASDKKSVDVVEHGGNKERSSSFSTAKRRQELRTKLYNKTATEEEKNEYSKMPRIDTHIPYNAKYIGKTSTDTSKKFESEGEAIDKTGKKTTYKKSSQLKVRPNFRGKYINNKR